MISDRDIYAALQAADHADELLAEGDLDGQRVWINIVKAIEALQRDKPVEGEKVH